jgi:hypothetical protein
MNKDLPKLNVRIADTPELQAKGLMFVKKMAEDAGMLFVFGSTQKLSFWGENTYIPLDIAFVNDKGFIENIDVINPVSRKSVSSKSACKYAIEANIGFFSKNNIDVGDYVFIDKKEHELRFAKRNSKEFLKIHKIAQQITDDIVEKYPTLSDYFNYLDANKENKKVEDAQDDKNLPVIDQNQIGQYLEDSIQEQAETQEEEGLPVKVPPTIKELEPKSVDQLEKEIPRFNNMSDAFNWGQENKQVMKISYQTVSKKRGLRYFGNNLITRYVEPHGRFTSRPENEPSHQILVTYDETVGGIRAFRLANVKEFSFVGRNFNQKFIFR